MEWSSDVGQADWIRARLSPFDSGVVTSVVPGGFEAYARVLHPAGRDEGEEQVPVRWSDIASWSGLPLLPHSQFPDIALPEHLPPGPAPFDAGPQEGTLATPDATALADILAAGSHAVPWWFCVWEGFGWGTSVMGWALTDEDAPWTAARAGWAEFPLRYRDASAPIPAGLEAQRVEVEAFRPEDPVPPDVRNGPRVRLPNRDHLLYSGEPLDALAFVADKQQTASLWWPSDHSWCVATEIDLAWTYVGGSERIVTAVVSDPRLEALRVPPDVSHRWAVPAWVAARAEQAARQIGRDGHAVLETPHGSLRAAVDTDQLGQWQLRIARGGDATWSAGSSSTYSERPPSHAELVRRLSRSVTELLP